MNQASDRSAQNPKLNWGFRNVASACGKLFQASKMCQKALTADEMAHDIQKRK